MNFRLPREWVSFGLPGYRDNPRYHTYAQVPLDELPPIERVLDPGLDWLLQEPIARDWCIASAHEEDYARLRGWLEELKRTYTIPEGFTAFVASPAAPMRIRSATGCYLDFGQRVVPSEDGGVLIHFLSDQQWSRHWLLYLSPSSDEGVIAAYPPYGFDRGEEEDSPLAEYGVESVSVFRPGAPGSSLCGDSFLEFIYRYWIENEIFFRLRDGGLTHEQRRYLDFYRNG